MKKIWESIQKHDQIMLFRHVNPDLDALGSQLGMYWTLKAIFPDKNIVLQGTRESSLFQYYGSIDPGVKQEKKTMGIVLDTANQERIDGDISVCDQVLKIDHHIVVDPYGDLRIEKEEASSCSEIVTLFFKELDIDIPIQAAEALYLGMIADSNRFLYSSTSQKTFEAASHLLDKGIDIECLYQKLYLRQKKDLKMMTFIYTHYQEDDNIVWYCLNQNDLETLGITRDEGSRYVNTLANIEEFKVWMAITENTIDNNWRVSIRSRGVAINDVASDFRGGGHMYASGATLSSLDELDLLIKKLKEKINE